MDAFLVGLIWILVYALCIAFVCWIVTKLMVQFFEGSSAFTWVVWAIGGLILLLLIVRLLLPALPGG